MSQKEVHWKLTVDEYEVHDSPESWTSPLPSPHPSPPATPHPSPNLPLPATLELHPALTPDHALQLDLSFPSDAFRRNPQLTQALLNEPACSPPRTDLYVRIAAGLYKAKLGVQHADGPPGQPVTVGDVLTVVQHALRQYDHGTGPPEAAPYMRRRIATVNGYCEHRSAGAKAAGIAAERASGGRMADHLLGYTQFAGLTREVGQPDHCWELALQIPPRYAKL
ncbi:hypothetical protein B0H15DRAFT_948518 [Mycena belliarum]|uniref:DUF6699 domain-containing protein n=1 Tax=Mycena belliarum TaxID=1033014 RepID=A0AAD6XPY7_9AGAR|nr:hypothetical protein B0H15DRAFT_948518 [Mycena belliae]